jgi:5-methylcytosine-specific restriction endonuclease McrA
MQFSTTEEHVRLVERAKALLARTAPGRSLGELHHEAMQLLVARLEKAKFAARERPQPAEPAPAKAGGGAELGSLPNAASQEQEPRREQRSAPRRRGRYVAAAVKREVFVRDAGRCNYVDERGGRCRETRYLELHHLKPFAHGGEHAATNLALRCAAHNVLAAEEDFGRAIIEHKRHPRRHESVAAQARGSGPAAMR